MYANQGLFADEHSLDNSLVLYRLWYWSHFRLGDNRAYRVSTAESSFVGSAQ